MRALNLTLPLLTLMIACSSGKSDGDATSDTGDNTTDSDGGGDDGGGDDGGSEGFTPSPLTPLSDGQCPDMSGSGTSTFSSSGTERTVTLITPSGGAEDTPLVFFFHGLMDPASTPEPTVYMSDALNLQATADQLGVTIVLPQSELMSAFGMSFFMWDAGLETDADLVFYDDLRTCAVEELGVDINRLTAWGFSGGALWTTVLAGHRGDTIATMIEMSGGSDVDIALLEAVFSVYETPSWPMPALLMAGGTNDVWPSASLALVDFEASTDSLQDQLVADGHFVVRCSHTQGHTVPTKGFAVAKDWFLAHRFGEESPYSIDGIGDWDSWCEIASE